MDKTKLTKAQQEKAQKEETLKEVAKKAAEAVKKKAAEALKKKAEEAAQKAEEEKADEEASQKAKEEPAKKKAKLDEMIVPAEPMGGSVSSGSGMLAEPQLPKEKDIPRAGCREFMKYCVPWVNHRMPIILKTHDAIASDMPMPEHAPLTIEDSSSSKVRTYKERWNAHNCKLALTLTGFYEAGGNLAWLDPEVLNQLIPSDDPPLSWIMEHRASNQRSTKTPGLRSFASPW